MLDLLDVVKRIGPKFPLDAMFLDPHDPEWDDDMTYLYVDYPYYKKFLMFGSLTAFIFLYNYNMHFHNKNMQYPTKITLSMLFLTSNMIYYKYRKQVLRCNLFDEYVQMRADELIKEREPLLRGEAMTNNLNLRLDVARTMG